MKGLGWIWNKWQQFGRFLGDIIGRLVLTFFYFTIFVPFGLVTRLFRDPLAMRKSHSMHWAERTTGDQTLDDAGRLF